MYNCIIYSKADLTINYSIMLTSTNKTKAPLISLVSPRNTKPINISFNKNNSNPQNHLLNSNLSFTGTPETKTIQKLNSQKHQSKNNLKVNLQISKNLSSLNIRNTWTPGPKDHLVQQTQKNFFQKETNKLKTTQTFESEALEEDKAERQKEFHDIKKSQPFDPSIRKSTAQLKQEYLLKQSPQLEPLKFSQSTTNLKPTLQSSISNISHKNQQNEKAIADSRLKLRDYLFMVSTSTNLAADKKHSQNSSLNSSEKGNSKKKSFSRLNQTKIVTNPEKYKITNQQMCQVLKKQIKVDLNNLKTKLHCLGKWVNGLESVDNDQMKHLYELRREVQLYSTQIQDYCVNKMRITYPSARESIVNIIHQNEQEDFFVEI